jgi:peptidyl-prolyl cis-trans isomerase C
MFNVVIHDAVGRRKARSIEGFEPAHCTGSRKAALQTEAMAALAACISKYNTIPMAPSKAAGGEMSWISFKLPLEEGKTQGLPLPVAQAVAQLPVGAVTPAAIPVIQGSGTLYVVAKLDAKRPTVVPGFNQARDTIRQQLQPLAVEKASAQFVAGQLRTQRSSSSQPSCPAQQPA